MPGFIELSRNDDGPYNFLHAPFAIGMGRPMPGNLRQRPRRPRKRQRLMFESLESKEHLDNLSPQGSFIAPEAIERAVVEIGEA